MTIEEKNYIHVIIQFDTCLEISEKRVMMKSEYTVGMIMQKIRHKWCDDVKSKQALFLFFKDTIQKDSVLQPITKTIGTIHEEMGYPALITIYVKAENTFGTTPLNLD